MNTFISTLALFFVLVTTGVSEAHNFILPSNDPPGISFFKGSWKDALAEAKRQNKPVFLDVYTSWCPPCKRMALEAFPNPKLGNRYNVHFINYQVDAEKGEGIALARQYLVASYPTSLFIAPNGNLIHRAVGYGGINAMLVQADHVLALPGLKATVAKGDKAFAEGKRDPNFLKKYLQTRQSLNRPISDVLDAYINALSEGIDTETTESFSPDSIGNTPQFNPPLKNQVAYRKVAHSLDEIADTYRQSGTSAADWQVALVWMEHSIRLYRTHSSLHTYARLLKKLGRHQDAINAQKEAILEARKEGWPIHDYEDELADMSRT